MAIVFNPIEPVSLKIGQSYTGSIGVVLSPVEDAGEIVIPPAVVTPFPPQGTLDWLRQAIKDWLDGDSAIARTDDCIALAEFEFRRVLVMPDQETSLTIDVLPVTPLPDDCDSVRSIYLRGDTPVTMGQVSVANLGGMNREVKGVPQIYAVSNNRLSTYPSPDKPYAATLVYRKRIPALTDESPSNWLLVNHPDLYLFGSLLQAEFFGWNDARLPIIKARVEEMIGQVNGFGQRKRYGGGPIAMRPTVREFVRRSSYR